MAKFLNYENRLEIGSGLKEHMTFTEFDEEMDAQKKIDLLEKGHHLSMTDALKEEVADMCKYTAIIEEKGIEKGMQKERIEAIRNMIRYGVSKETILRDYSEEEYKKAERGMLVNA